MSRIYAGVLMGFAMSAFAMTSTAATWRQEVVSQTSLSIPTDGRVRIDVNDANVTVLGGASSNVEVEVRLSSDNIEAAKAAFEKTKFSAESRGNDVVIRSRRKSSSWRSGHFEMFVVVKTPTAVRLDVSTKDGDISAEKVTGDIELRTADGDVRARDISGRRVVISTKDGDVTAERVAGDVRVATSDGDMRLTNISGTKLEARTSDGDISARDITPERIDLKTGDGDAAMLKIAAVPTRARTSDGDISIVVDSAIAARVKLRGDNVRISGKAVFQGDLERRRVEGTLNQGGPLIEMSTGDGSIKLAIQD